MGALAAPFGGPLRVRRVLMLSVASTTREEDFTFFGHSVMVLTRVHMYERGIKCEAFESLMG